MRRDIRRQKRMDNTVILSIVCAILILVGIVTYVIKNYLEKENNSSLNLQEDLAILENADIKDTSTEYGKTVEESKEEIIDGETLKEEKDSANTNKAENTTSTSKKAETKKEENSTNVVTTKPAQEEKEKELTFKAPVKGEIVREYAVENLVYSETLKEWITHNGIDIKADKTTVVTAAAPGKVYAIKNDPRYGLTVIIEHDDGFKTVYSNLLTAEFVVEGENVEEGQTIGTVGSSGAFEISDDYHLHFEMLKDDAYVNPTTYINFD